MGRTRLHWAWRVAIATIAACAFAALSTFWFLAFYQGAADAMSAFFGFFLYSDYLVVSVVWFGPTILLAFAVFGVLTRRFADKGDPDDETRCRKCRYILRGITEPRCPECGERI